MKYIIVEQVKTIEKAQQKQKEVVIGQEKNSVGKQILLMRMQRSRSIKYISMEKRRTIHNGKLYHYKGKLMILTRKKNNNLYQNNNYNQNK